MKIEHGLLALIAVIIFSAVPTFSAPDGHNFTAYYLITVFGLSLLPIRWEVKLFAVVCAASCIWLQLMVAFVEPQMKPLFLRLYAAGNASYQFVAIFIGLYAMVAILKPDMSAWLSFLRYIALIEIIRISCQRLGWDPLYIPIDGSAITEAAGSQGNIGWSGAMLAMCAPAFFDRKLWWGLIPVIGALYIEKSTTPVIALSGAMMLFACVRLKPGKALIAIALVLAGIFIYLGYDINSPDRFSFWKRALELSWDREAWLLGYGLGSWRTLFNAAYEFPTIIAQAHNEPVQVYFELGFMGVLVMLLYGRFLILRFMEAGKDGAGIYASAGMATVILCSLGNFPFHLAGTAVLAVGWMGMFEITTKVKNENNPNPFMGGISNSSCAGL